MRALCLSCLALALVAGCSKHKEAKTTPPAPSSKEREEAIYQELLKMDKEEEPIVQKIFSGQQTTEEEDRLLRENQTRRAVILSRDFPNEYFEATLRFQALKKYLPGEQTPKH